MKSSIDGTEHPWSTQTKGPLTIHYHEHPRVREATTSGANKANITNTSLDPKHMHKHSKSLQPHTQTLGPLSKKERRHCFLRTLNFISQQSTARILPPSRGRPHQDPGAALKLASLGSTRTISSPPSFLPAPSLQKKIMSHHWTQPSTMALPSLPPALPTIRTHRPLLRPKLTVPCGGNQLHWADCRPELVPHRPTRRPLLPRPDGMARDRNRWTWADLGASDSTDLRRLRPSRGQGDVPPRCHSWPTQQSTTIVLHAAHTVDRGKPSSTPRSELPIGQDTVLPGWTSKSRTNTQQHPLRRLVLISLRRRHHWCPHTKAGDQTDGFDLLQVDRLQPHLRPDEGFQETPNLLKIP